MSTTAGYMMQLYNNRRHSSYTSQYTNRGGQRCTGPPWVTGLAEFAIIVLAVNTG